MTDPLYIRLPVEVPDADDSRRLREVLALLRARVASGDVRASVLVEALALAGRV